MAWKPSINSICSISGYWPGLPSNLLETIDFDKYHSQSHICVYYMFRDFRGILQFSEGIIVRFGNG
jgi:hypothetical protein